MCEFRVGTFRHLRFQKTYLPVPPPKWGRKLRKGKTGNTGNWRPNTWKEVKEIPWTKIPDDCSMPDSTVTRRTMSPEPVITIIHFSSGLLNWQYLASLMQILGLSEPSIPSFPYLLHCLDCQGHSFLPTEFLYFDLFQRDEGWPQWAPKEEIQSSVLLTYSCWMSLVLGPHCSLARYSTVVSPMFPRSHSWLSPLIFSEEATVNTQRTYSQITTPRQYSVYLFMGVCI